MKPSERVWRRLRGEPVDRAPNFSITMTFAAHYIGQPLSRYYLDHKVLAEANLAVQTDFELDILQVISDPYREAADLGAVVEFPDDGLPLCKEPLIKDLADVGRLVPPRPEKGRRMSDRLSAIRYLRERVGGEIPIMGWVEGGLAEAADLRGVSNLLTDLYDSPDRVRELLELCVEMEVAFAKAQVDAGADIIGMGDAIASQVSRDMYREFALPYEQRIFAVVKETGALCRLHICGDITHILDDVVESGADIVDVDWMVDFGQAARACGQRAAVCGNFDPVAVLLQGTPDKVRRAVFRCLEQGGEKSIIMAGCEVPADTPYANLKAVAQALQEAAAGQVD